MGGTVNEPLEVSADTEKVASSGRCSLREVVDAVGVGPAQTRVLLLGAGGINFCDGAELVLGNAVILSVSKDFGLGFNERACLSTMTLTGLMVGSFSSGYVGDTVGRRRPTIWCFLWTVVMGFVCSCMPNYYCLLVARTVLGIGMGFGMPPSSAMISEITPEKWRIVYRVGSSSAFALGGLFISLCAACDDPTLKNLHWRHLMLYAAIPPVVFWICASMFLHESPVFLAALGQHKEARRVFRSMAWFNSSELANLEYVEPNRPADGRGGESVLDQLGMVFSPALRYTTIVTFYAAFCINLVSYGDGYAAPQVLTETSRMLPGWEMVIKAVISILWVIITGVLAEVSSRKAVMLLATAISSTVCFAFAVAGAHPAPRPPGLALLFMYGANGAPIGSALGYVVIFQIAVEVYPTAASTTGGALIMGGGRLAALIAPLIFENIRRATDSWTPFYYFMGSASALATILTLFVRPIKAYRPGEEDEASESAKCSEHSGMATQEKTREYGSMQ